MQLTIQNFGLPVTLIFLLPFCLFGCSSDEDTLFPTDTDLESLIAQAIDEDSLQERSKEGEELYYAPNQETPYTGWVKLYYYDEEQLHRLYQIHKGKIHGAYIVWHENGQKAAEGTYKDGEEDGKWTAWHENGQKAVEGTYKDGKEDGKVTAWHENGQKAVEGTYKDGEKDGAWTYWAKDGEQISEWVFRSRYSSISQLF